MRDQLAILRFHVAEQILVLATCFDYLFLSGAFQFDAGYRQYGQQLCRRYRRGARGWLHSTSPPSLRIER